MRATSTSYCGMEDLSNAGNQLTAQYLVRITHSSNSCDIFYIIQLRSNNHIIDVRVVHHRVLVAVQSHFRRCCSLLPSREEVSRKCLGRLSGLRGQVDQFAVEVQLEIAVRLRRVDYESELVGLGGC